MLRAVPHHPPNSNSSWQQPPVVILVSTLASASAAVPISSSYAAVALPRHRQRPVEDNTDILGIAIAPVEEAAQNLEHKGTVAAP